MIRQNSSDIKGTKHEPFRKKSTAISDKAKRHLLCRQRNFKCPARKNTCCASHKHLFLNRPLSWRFQIFLPCGEVCDSYWWRYSTEIRVLSLIGCYLRAKIQNCATTSDVISVRWISLFQALTVREDRIRMPGIGWQLSQSYYELQTRYVN